MKTSDKIKAIDTVIKSLKKDFTKCRTYSAGCASCVAHELVEKLEWVRECYEVQEQYKEIDK